MVTMAQWQVTSVANGTSGRGDWAASALNACLQQGWEPFAVSGEKIWLRRQALVETPRSASEAAD